MSRTETDVVVVGAGPAGLSAAGAMKQRGTSAVLLERDSRIGERWSERYERLCLHTVRRYSGLAHRGMPSDYPRYVPKGQFADYLADYTAHFDLDVRTDHRVERVAQAANGGGWEVETDAGGWYARAVVIATGHYNEPIVPSWPGKDRFGGTLVHSGVYRSGSEYARRSVLVVGIGNSGAEIAADLVEQGAARVAIAVRTPPPIMPRELLGILPVQLLGIALTPLNAPELVDRIGAVTRRVAVGDLTEVGLAKAEWGPFTARRPPVIDVGFLEQLKARRIGVRPAVTDLTTDGALFADGREEPFDVVVAATGFRSGLSELLDVPDALGDDGRPHLRSGEPTSHPGLYFIGYEETMRGVLYEINRESKRLALSIESYLANGDGTSTA